MTEDQIKSLQSTGGDHLAATEKNILGNDLNRLWEHAKYLRERTGGRIDFILDNAGFELYCDCVYGIFRSLLCHVVSLISHYSRLLAPKWTSYTDSISRKAVSMVCFRCYEEGLGVAHEQYGLWPIVSKRKRH